MSPYSLLPTVGLKSSFLPWPHGGQMHIPLLALERGHMTSFGWQINRQQLKKCA